MTDVYTAEDISVINDRMMADYAKGDVVTISFENNLSSQGNGKNGNSLAAHVEDGQIALVTLRLVMNSPDDKYLNTIFQQWQSHDPNFTPMTGSFTKNTVNEQKQRSSSSVECNFGFPVKRVEQKENTDGDLEQVTAVYSIRFSRSQRVIS